MRLLYDFSDVIAVYQTVFVGFRFLFPVACLQLLLSQLDNFKVLVSWSPVDIKYIDARSKSKF